jgi:hypothetical protein
MATVKVDVPIRAPAVAPGAGVTEALKAGLFICKGPRWSFTDGTGVQELFRVPADTFVYDVIVDVKTAMDATAGTLTIGDSDDVDGYHTTATALPKVIGSKSSHSLASVVYSGGKSYADSDGRIITGTFGEGTGANTAGAIDTYLVYNNFSSLL